MITGVELIIFSKMLSGNVLNNLLLLIRYYLDLEAVPAMFCFPFVYVYIRIYTYTYSTFGFRMIKVQFPYLNIVNTIT